MDISNFLVLIKNGILDLLKKPELTSFMTFITIIAMWILTQRQIRTMKKIEKDKRKIATISLIYEIERNKEWVFQFIHDCEKGAHEGKKDKDVLCYTWVWNPPQVASYENYLSTVCYDDQNLARKIMSLYASLESCRVLVYFIHELLINDGEAKIIKYNTSIKNICFKIKDSFEDPIKKLRDIGGVGFDEKMITDVNQGLVLTTGLESPTRFARSVASVSAKLIKNNKVNDDGLI